MKTMIGIFLLVVLFAIPAFGEDEEMPYNYAIKCYPVTISGKMVVDNYETYSVNIKNLTLVIFGFWYDDSYTSDRMKAGIFDENGENTEALATFSGNIVWNEGYTKASIIGTLERVNEEITNNRAFYLDGTLKKSRNKYTLSAKGGETDTHNQSGFSFVASFSKISSSSCLEIY